MIRDKFLREAWRRALPKVTGDGASCLDMRRHAYATGAKLPSGITVIHRYLFTHTHPEWVTGVSGDDLLRELAEIARERKLKFDDILAGRV